MRTAASQSLEKRAIRRKEKKLREWEEGQAKYTGLEMWRKVSLRGNTPGDRVLQQDPVF